MMDSRKEGIRAPPMSVAVPMLKNALQTVEGSIFSVLIMRVSGRWSGPISHQIPGGLPAMRSRMEKLFLRSCKINSVPCLVCPTSSFFDLANISVRDSLF